MPILNKAILNKGASAAGKALSYLKNTLMNNKVTNKVVSINKDISKSATYHEVKASSTFLRKLGGAAIGSYIGYKLSNDSFIGAGLGLVGGGAAGRFAPQLYSGAKFIGKKIWNNPIKTAGTIAAASSIYSFTKPIIKNPFVDILQNRPTNPALQNQKTGPGYVTMGSSARISVPHNNLGATGDLTLSLYRNRHKRY